MLNDNINQSPKFELGRTLMTRQVFNHLAEPKESCSLPSVDTIDGVSAMGFLFDCRSRHACGNWGDIHPEDVGLNDAALETGERLLSVYQLPEKYQAPCHDDRIWIITEADRSKTTTLFPSDY